MLGFEQISLITWLKAYLDLAVFGLLGFMSFLLIGFTCERLIYFARVDVNRFADRNRLNIALTRHLTALASIASLAPYIGLLGTVLGILISFHDMAQSRDMSANDIMLGLALALKATAAGLFVAIPATLFYNSLLRRVDVLTGLWDSLRGRDETA